VPRDQIFEARQEIHRPLEEVFEFFASEKNLERITPPWLNFKVVSMTTPEITDGTRINYTLKIHGIPVRWQSVIEEWIPNQRFVDRQAKGPYALWHHTHQFQRTANGTLMTDTVRYRLPLGGLGNFVAGRWVAKDIKQIFDYRAKVITTLL